MKWSSAISYTTATFIYPQPPACLRSDISIETGMNAEPDAAPPKIALRFERWLVIASALATLGWLTWQAPPDLTRPGEAALVLLFSALLVYYPIHLLRHEYFLLPIVTLGAAILFGATTAAWSASLGAVLGYGTAPPQPCQKQRSLPSASAKLLGRRLASRFPGTIWRLLLAFILTGLPVGLVSAGTESLLAAKLWSLWQPLIVFACLDSLLYLIDSLLEQRGSLGLAGAIFPC